MLRINPATINYNDVDYEIQLGTIDFTRLGREDHGIFTFLLDFKFGGSGQGAGTYNLNDPRYMGQLIQAVLDFFKCNWEDLTGKRAFVLRESHSGPIRGLMDEKQSKVLIFADELKGS